MDSLRTGSDELVYIQTGKVCLTIKGAAAHPNFQGIEYNEGDSSVRIFCNEDYELSLKGSPVTGNKLIGSNSCSGIYSTLPMFFEQQRYELIIEAAEGQTVSFWHDSTNIRNKITPTGRHHNILSGIINFGNEIGFSDLVIQINGTNYLRLVIEVFPSKISYNNDYKAIIEDVTKEVYNIVFDFLKKTYLGYQQSDRATGSPVEFFAVIQHIYADFLKAADMILFQPHHLLETKHEVIESRKIRRTDAGTRRWVEKHPEQAIVQNGSIHISKALAVKKQVTYDTKENRLTKYIFQSTAKKLKSFKQNYLHLQREDDRSVINSIDHMIHALERRSNTSFLADVTPHEASSGMSLVFSMAPGYRELYRYYLMLLRGLSISGDVFHISVKDLALLYEYWCFIKLNSMMKDRYQLVSQDIIRTQGNGLYISLVKGQGSKVKYRDTGTGEVITLSYNPKVVDIPTVSQRPDNVLTLEKNGSDTRYEYIFDAKYRINPALPGSDYYNSVSHKPGPEVSDINTMHRYRDAIVYQNGASPFERTMFGAYVLFPYGNEKEYRHHRFFESIAKVNVGGLPFLPSATGMVSSLLDELISDSPDSAFERAPLPRGIEEKLAKVDWSVRDVLIGALSSKAQLNICLKYNFYHVPQRQIKESDLPVHYVAIYQSINNGFGADAGIRYYGEVLRCSSVKRSEITEIPKLSEELYYRFEIKEWKKLSRPIVPKEFGFSRSFTNTFLLEHSEYIPELYIRSEQEYRLYSELRRALNHAEINDVGTEIGFRFDNALVVFEDGEIHIFKEGRLIAKYDISDFTRHPNAVFRRIKNEMCGAGTGTTKQDTTMKV